MIVQQSAALRARFHIYFASQPISRQTVFKGMRFRRLHDLETVSFWKRSTFESVFKTTRFW